ncbi:MAG TPA: efflux transporter outer membrane subunit, partial [Gemmatimonadales bacterium]|nr:efflux transporter outer membrane subunit [Gemmatimonadales bacterium]
PEMDIPAAFKEAQALAPQERGRWKVASPSEHLARGEWWRVFDDSVLDTLEQQAAEANPGLKAAAARVVQARAVAGIARADRAPQVDVGFGPTRSRLSAVAAGLPEGAGVPTTTTWRALASVSYEVDLFGRVANSVSAAQSDAEGAQATYRSVLLALQADVATFYFALRQTDAELALLRDTVRLREESVQLLQRRFDAGDIGELDLARAKTELATTQSDAVGLERTRAEQEHALAVLLGKAPAAFTLAPAPVAGTAPPPIPPGLPSALLERRPDIAAAQRAMAAANARIGVARSAFFPSLVLTGNGGFESADLSDLFRWSSRTWLLGPLFGTLLTQTVFDGGRRQANVERTRGALEESVADYRQRVLAAFGEVEDSLAALRVLAEQAGHQRQAIANSRRAVHISRSRYDAGLVNYLDVIDAQRSLLAAERQATQIQGAREASTVALVRALGGGWSSVE